jgi:hypothetical protein
MQVSDVLVLTVCCKLVNFVFQMFPLFIPEMSAGFTSYIVQIIPIYCTWILLAASLEHSFCLFSSVALGLEVPARPLSNIRRLV